MTILTQQLIQQVLQAVREAGALLTDPDAVRQVTARSETDFVTNVDLAVQSLLHTRLAALTPEAQLLGEEGDSREIDPARPFWILDPVDGTTNLIHSFRHSAISLALAEEGKVTFGVVLQPYTGECFTARAGEGSFLNGTPIHVGGAAALADSMISVGTVPGHRELADQAFAQIRRIYDSCQDVRRTGCASLDLSYVACGRLDGYVELCLQPWDYAAGLLLVTEAGGAVTALDDIEEGVSYIKQGFSLLIFPEGTRSRGGRVKEFKKGSLKLATKPGVPVVPITIDGSYRIYEEKGKVVNNAKVAITIHPAIPTAGMSKTEQNQLAERVQHIIESALPEELHALEEAPKENNI